MTSPSRCERCGSPLVFRFRPGSNVDAANLAELLQQVPTCEKCGWTSKPANKTETRRGTLRRLLAKLGFRAGANS
jgi:hypothetical protein